MKDRDTGSADTPFTYARQAQRRAGQADLVYGREGKLGVRTGDASAIGKALARRSGMLVTHLAVADVNAERREFTRLNPHVDAVASGCPQQNDI
jgi:hypothetical protein